MNKILLSIIAVFMSVSCSSTLTEVKITNSVINGGYLGNGAEWDPYCEADMWGAPMTPEMWNKIFERTDFMKMSIVRCMISSPFRYFNAKTQEYEKERNSESLKTLLSYCQKNNIIVMFGEFNPPNRKLKLDAKWVKMSVNYLNYLVIESGFTCIKYYIPTNEPDGYWSVYDGDYNAYLELVRMFQNEIANYPNLALHIKLAGPDVVLDYKNSKYDLTTKDRVDLAAKQIDSIIGIYEIHAYPGYYQVSNGIFTKMLKEVVASVPKGKKLVLGEAGYKTWRKEDSTRNMTHLEKLSKTPLIVSKEGADCNMNVYDFQYGIDMSLLAIEVMNNGGSGVCPWMLDDSHSFGDKGNIHNVKIWGMWNIFGGKLWKMPQEENIRPWYYAWSLMCRYFPSGSDILKVDMPDIAGLKITASISDNKLTVALLNISDQKRFLNLALPVALANAKLYLYKEGNRNLFENMPPKPDKTGIKAENHLKVEISPNSLIVISDYD